MAFLDSDEDPTLRCSGTQGRTPCHSGGDWKFPSADPTRAEREPGGWPKPVRRLPPLVRLVAFWPSEPLHVADAQGRTQRSFAALAQTATFCGATGRDAMRHGTAMRRGAATPRSAPESPYVRSRHAIPIRVVPCVLGSMCPCPCRTPTLQPIVSHRVASHRIASLRITPHGVVFHI